MSGLHHQVGGGSMTRPHYDPDPEGLFSQAFGDRWNAENYAGTDHMDGLYTPEHPDVDVREALRFAAEATEDYANEGPFGIEAIEALEAAEEFMRWASVSLEVT